MSGFERRPKRKLASEMNVVPYIDVMLVLLVIFMITAPLLQTGVEVSLPEGSGQIDNKDEAPVVVTVSRDNRLYLSIADDPKQAIARETAVQLLQTSLGNNPTLKVHVAADQGIEYGEVMASIEWLKQVGVTRVGLVTKPVE
ncbi:MAG: biopolymer transporter ExbD [Gammaproteobacteria bacterium]|nr:biopolymer transporter ExbD [Gammaproteobacteria bacterium]